MSELKNINVEPAKDARVFDKPSGGRLITGPRLITVTPWIRSRLNVGDLILISKAKVAKSTSKPSPDKK